MYIINTGIYYLMFKLSLYIVSIAIFMNLYIYQVNIKRLYFLC